MSHQPTSAAPSTTVGDTATITTADTATTAADTATITTADTTTGSGRSALGTYPECPLCGGDLFAEHAHFKCSGCGWRDSCCD